MDVREFQGVKLEDDESLIRSFNAGPYLVGVTSKRVIVVSGNTVASLVPKAVRRVQSKVTNYATFASGLLAFVIIFILSIAVAATTKDFGALGLLFFGFFIAVISFLASSKLVYYTEINDSIKIPDQNGEIFNAVLEAFKGVKVERAKVERNWGTWG